MTHAELVKLSCKFAKSLGFPLVISERHGARNGEIPDVIAFRGGGDSLVIECKVSRSDFQRDKNKPFRNVPYASMGMYRMYVMTESCLPKGTENEIPPNWNYALVNNKGEVTSSSLKSMRNMALSASNVKPFLIRNLRDENGILYSYIRTLSEEKNNLSKGIKKAYKGISELEAASRSLYEKKRPDGIDALLSAFYYQDCMDILRMEVPGLKDIKK